MGKRFIFESYPYSRLQNANHFALVDGIPFNWAACCESFCLKLFFGQLPSAKQLKIWIFSKQIRHSPLPSAFLIFDALFLQPFFGRSICLFFSWQCCNWRPLEFSAADSFPPASFCEKNWKPWFFQRASVTLSHSSALISHVWHPKAG